MVFSSWLKSLGNRIRRHSSRRRPRLQTDRRHRAADSNSIGKSIELLETRMVLSSTQWTAMGPFLTLNGQPENVDLPGPNPVIPGRTESPVIGAINVVLPHPSNADVLFVAGVNGGVWRTMNATATSPTWEPLTDSEASLSIGAMAFDADDPSGSKLYVAIGRNSSLSALGGALTGVLFTEDALGVKPTFVRKGDTTLLERNITGITAAGSMVVVSTNTKGGGVAPGVYRSADSGDTFEAVPELVGTAFDLVQDPGNSDRLYAAVKTANHLITGVFRSDSGGLIWENVGVLVNGFITDSTNNMELAIHNNAATHTNAVYVVVVNNGQAAGILRSSQGVDGIDNDNNGFIDEPAETKFVAMDLPKSLEGPVAISGATNASPVVITSSVKHGLSTTQSYQAVISGVEGNLAANGEFTIQPISETEFQLVNVTGTGNYTGGGNWQLVSPLQPRAKAGGQGAIHLSVVADPNDPFIVYVGGDRQDAPSANDPGFSLPNSLGARDFSAKIFKGDASIDRLDTTITVGVPGSQWSPLTHIGTFSISAPHADSRDMAFDASGRLIQGDDGGVYFRIGARGGAIAEIVNDEPIVIRSRSHGLKSGDQVRITGVTGKEDANGSFTVTRLNSDEFALNGTDDDDPYTGGGVWGSGDWFSLNTGLQLGEFHDIAYDSNSHAIIAGAQDNGTQEQNPLTGNPKIWNLALGGDGGDVAVDNVTLAAKGQSIRYSSSQDLGSFRQRVVGQDGLTISTTSIPHTVSADPIGAPITIDGATNQNPIRINAPGHGLHHGSFVTISGVGGNTAANGTFVVINPDANHFLLYKPDRVTPVDGTQSPVYTGGGSALRKNAPFEAQFLTPFVLNANNPKRMVIIGNTAIFESDDQGTTLHDIGEGAAFFPNSPAHQNAIAYGDKPGGAHPNVLYVGLGDRLYKRITGTGDVLEDESYSSLPESGKITDVVLDPDNPFTVYVVDTDFHVWQGQHLDYSLTDGIDNDGDGFADGADVAGDEVPFWTNISDNIPIVGGRSAAFIPGEDFDVLVVGTLSGVVMRRIDSDTQSVGEGWIELGGESLPNVPVWDLVYDDKDKVLVAGTLGRGAWKINTAGTFGAPSPNALFETTGGSGDMLTIDLNDYTFNNSFAINSISMPDVGEVVTMTPNELGLELSVDTEVIGQIVFPENLGGLAFETGGVFHFLPTLSDTNTYDDDSGERGFQGRLKVNVGAGAFEHSVYFNVAPGYSLAGGEFAVTNETTPENMLRLQQRLAYLGFPDATGQLPTPNGVLDESTAQALRLFQTVTDPKTLVVPIEPVNFGTGYGLASGTLESESTIQWLNSPIAPQWGELVDPDPRYPIVGFFQQDDPFGRFDYLPLPDPGSGVRTGETPATERFGSSWVVDTFRAALLELDVLPDFFDPPEPHTPTGGEHGTVVVGLSNQNGVSSAEGRFAFDPGRHHVSGMEIEIALPLDGPSNGYITDLLEALDMHAAIEGRGIVINDVVLPNESSFDTFANQLNQSLFAGRTNRQGGPIARPGDEFDHNHNSFYIQFAAPELPPELSPGIEEGLNNAAGAFDIIAEFLRTLGVLNDPVPFLDESAPNANPGAPPTSASGASGTSSALVSPSMLNPIGTPSVTPISSLPDDKPASIGDVLGLNSLFSDGIGQKIGDYLVADFTPTLGELVTYLDLQGGFDNVQPVVDSADKVAFSFDYSAARHITRELNFGDGLASAGLDLDTTGLLDLEVGLSTTITIGVDLSQGLNPAEAVTLQFAPIHIQAKADIPGPTDSPMGLGLDVAARLGFFGVSIEDGSLHLAASVDALVNNSLPFSISDLLSINPATFFGFSGLTSSIAATLPIRLQIGSFDSNSLGIKPQVVVQDSNFFDDMPPSFALTLPPKLNLFSVDAGGINGVLDQVRDFLKSAQDSPLLAAQIPFTKGTSLGDVFDFALAFDQQINNFTIGLDGLPSFGTVQGLADELPGLDDAVPIDIVQDGGDQVLIFNFDLSKTFTPKSVKLSLNELGGADVGVAGITTNSSVSLAAQVGAAFSMGILLEDNGAGVPIDGLTPISAITPVMEPKPGQTEVDRWDFLNTNGATADVKITLRSGAIHNINLSGLTSTSTLQQLADAINAAVGPNFAKIQNKRFVFTDPSTPAGPNPAFKIQDANGSGLAMLTQLIGQDSDSDGVITSAPLHGKTLADRVFIEDAALTAIATLTANDIDATATFGGLIGIAVVNGFGSINVGATISLNDPNPATEHITLGDLIKETKDLGKGSDLINIGLNAAADLTLPIQVTTPAGDLGLSSLNALTSASPQIAISWPNVFTIDVLQGDVELNTDTLSVQFSGFEELLNFKDFSIDDIIDMLQEVATFLGNLAKNEPFFKDKLPVIDKSPAELLGFANKFVDAIQAFKKNPGLGLNQIEAELNSKLGPEFGTIDLSLDLSGGEPVVKVELPFTVTIADVMLPLNFDLDALNVPGLKDLVDFQTSGQLDVDANVMLDLVVGLEILSGDPRAFLYDEETQFSTNLTITGPDLDFKASLGPFGVQVVNGVAKLDVDGLGPLTAPASAMLALTDGDGDGRHYLDEGIAPIVADLNFSLTGMAGINLPVKTLNGQFLDPINENLKVVITDIRNPIGSFAVQAQPDFAGLLAALDFGNGIDGIIAGLDGLLTLLENVLGGDSNFPSIGTEIHLYWGLDDLSNIDPPTIEFRDVGLNMGEFITDFFGGALEVVQDIVEPLQPILDVLTTPLPVISDLLGQPTALVDLARVFGLAEVADFIEAVDTISDLVNMPSLGDDLIIPLGGFTVTFDSNGAKITPDAVASDFDFGTALSGLGGSSAQAANSYFNSIPKTSPSQPGMPPASTKGKFDFPILNDPLMIFQLLLGKEDVTLVTYDMPPASFGFEYSQYFPIWGPIGARIGGEVGFNIDLAFGFDTQGFFDFARSLNVVDIFNGFYVSDTANPDGSGEDVPEMQLFGALRAAAELNLGIASASVGGGIFATIDFDLHDIPNADGDVDGKIRIPEIIENFLVGPIYIFDISGKIEAGLEATISALGFSETFEIARVTLLDFEIPRPVPTPSPNAILATLSNGVLTVNVGPNSAARVNGDLSDGNDNVVIRRGGTDDQIIVAAFGKQTTFDGVSALFIDAGSGNDVISIDGAAGEDTINAGAGNDNVTGGPQDDVIHGEAGDDKLYGGKDSDLISGGEGADSIFGEDGQDSIQGGAGNDVVDGGIANDLIEGGDGNDFIVGANGNDFISAGNGSDVVWGGIAVFGRATFDLAVPGNFTLPPEFAAFDLLNPSGYTPPQITPIVVAGNSLPGTPDDGEDVIRGGDGTDFLFGGGQTDDIRGGAGDDFIDGGVGTELIHGDAGDDVIFGGANDDNLFGDDGIDQLYGQEGNDILRAGAGVNVSGDASHYSQFNPLIATDVLDATGVATVHVMSGQRSYGGDGNDTMYAFAPTNMFSAESIRRGDERHGGGGIDFLKLDTAEFFTEVGDVFDGHFGNRTKGDVIDDNATDILLIEGSLLPDVITLLEQDVGITSKTDLAPALIANGKPSAAPVFTLTINGSNYGPITVGGTSDNTSLDDLVEDINTAIHTALLQFQETIAPEAVRAVRIGNRIRIETFGLGQQSQLFVTPVANNPTTNVMQTELQFFATQFGVKLLDIEYNAGNEVGITSTLDVPLNGRLTNTATFNVVVNGIAVNGVSIPAAATSGNNSIDDLVADLNAALNLALLNTPEFGANPTVLKAVRVENKIRLQTNGLGRDAVVTIQSPNAITTNELRFANGATGELIGRPTIRAGWRSPTGVPLVEQFRISGLGGDDELGFAVGAKAPDLAELSTRSRDWVGVIDGGSGDDMLSGSNARDRIDGGRGSDLIFGNGGDDRMFGDTNNGAPHDLDVMFGGAGNDDAIGGLGTNRLYAWSFDPTGPLHFDGEQSAQRVGTTPASLTAYARQPRSGVLPRDARFSLSTNGTTFTDIVLLASATTNNTKLAEVVSELQAVLTAAGISSGAVTVGVDADNRITFTAPVAQQLVLRTDQFGVFVAPNGLLVDTDGSAQSLPGSPFPEEDTGLNRMLGMSGNDTLFGGTGLDFLYGNDGDDVLITRHGEPFEAGFDVPAGDEWKAYAKATDKVWYYGGTNLDDVISVDYVTEPGLLGGHHLITRLTNNNGNFTFDAQVRLDFSATDDNGNPIFDATDVIESLESILEADPSERNLKYNELALSGGLLPPEGDFLAIIIDALDGNDVVNVGPTVLKTVWTDGGKGDDTIIYASGNPILVDRTEEQDRNNVAGDAANPSAAFSLFGPTILLGGVASPLSGKLSDIARFDVRFFGDDDFTRIRLLSEAYSGNANDTVRFEFRFMKWDNDAFADLLVVGDGATATVNNVALIYQGSRLQGIVNTVPADPVANLADAKIELRYSPTFTLIENAAYRVQVLGTQAVNYTLTAKTSFFHVAVADISGDGLDETLFSFPNEVLLTSNGSGPNYSGGSVLYPDCAFQLFTLSGRAFNFVVELDNGTERIRSPQDIERKLRGYDLHQSATPSFDHGRFVVLFVTTRSSERVAHILQAATRIMRNPRRTLFLGVTLSAFLNHDMPLTVPLFMSPTGRQQSLVPDDSASRQTLAAGQLATTPLCLESHGLRLTKMRGTPQPVPVVA